MKIEMAIAGAALVALGAFYATRPQVAEAVPVAVSSFTAADYAAFDRNFEIDGQACEIGLRRDRLCFGPSPVDALLSPGMVLPPHIPIVGAAFRVIVETELKTENLRTIRFGQTLALVDPETRRIEDVMNLAAPSFDEARRPPIH